MLSSKLVSGFVPKLFEKILLINFSKAREYYQIRFTDDFMQFELCAAE